ncbi:MAG: glycosyltransferase [Acidimicrobiales bacterium]
MRPSIDALRIYHSGVVTDYRQRDRELLRHGVRVVLVTARRWNEGGGTVTLNPANDRFVVGVGTLGRHPYLFVYDPRPLVRLLRSRHFDVIDAHEEPAALATAEIVLLRRLLQPRARLTMYSAQNIPKRYPLPFRWLERLALRSADAVHCCNQAAADNLRAKGFTGRLSVLGLGVDVANFRPADADQPANAGPTTGGLRVGFVGRLEARKGVWVLLDAMAQLAAAGVTLTFFGDGPDRLDLQGEIERRGLSASVRVEGFRNYDDLPAVYRALDVVCVPSLPTARWVEQFGRVAVEAMASGVPVVASTCGSLPEVIGDAGLLVPPGDVPALVDGLTRLANDAGLRSELAQRGRVQAQQYDWSEIAQAQRRLYLEVLK